MKYTILLKFPEEFVASWLKKSLTPSRLCENLSIYCGDSYIKMNIIKQIIVQPNGTANINGQSVGVDNGTPTACVNKLPEEMLNYIRHKTVRVHLFCEL